MFGTMSVLRHIAAWAACFLLAGAFVCSGAKPYEETGKTHSWLSLSRPAKSSPAAQLVHANELREKGRMNKARKAYHALTVTWPGTEEAATAQYMKATLLDRAGDHRDAFDAYQTLMEKYAGTFDYEEVLNRQFEIATQVMNKRRGRFLFLPGFKAPERAIPLFEDVIENGPRSPMAAEAQYLIGAAYEDSLQYELAVVAYLVALNRYPGSPFAELAAFGRTRTLYKLSEEYPSDKEALTEAWAAAVLFLNRYPASEYAADVKEYRDDLFDRRAKSAYDIARYYDTKAKRPDAARESYESFLRRFPESPWSDEARKRLAVLTNVVEKTNGSDDDHEQE